MFNKCPRDEAESSPRDNISRNPTDVMFYAVKHGYTDIVDMTYGLVLKEPLGEIVGKLPPHFILPWVRVYRKSNDNFADYAFK